MKKRYFVLLTYVILLALSQLVLLFFPPLVSAPEILKADLERSIMELPETQRNGSSTGETIKVAYVDSDSTTSNHPEMGEKPVVILIHGNPGSADNFAKIIPFLSHDFRVIAPDLPGFGQSSPYVTDYSIRAQAYTILSLMEGLKIQKAHVFGYSMGSGTAQYLTEIAPERVSSISVYGGIGVQEGEGSGDYYIEHFKYSLGYVGIVVLPELIPHFGLLGPRSFRHSTIRTFLDSDQRPLRDVLGSLQHPFQILHGIHDPLVPVWAAREHHRIVENSELIVLDDSHFMPFRDSSAEKLTAIYKDFITRYSQPNTEPGRYTRDMKNPPPDLPVRLDLDTRGNPWSSLATIIAATFVSEDLTIISAGILAGDGRLDLFLAILGCFLGIFIGDFGLWLIGVLIGGPIRNFSFTKKIIPQERMAGWKEWFDQNGGKAVFISRFVPGTRFITYLGAGLMGLSPGKFLFWAFVAGAIWSPLLVILSAVFGPIFARFFISIFGENLLAVIFALIFLFLFIRLFTLLFSMEGRSRLSAMIQKLWRWEFWPSWMMNAPVVVHNIFLGLRYGKITVFTAANPGIPYGGVVGESKMDTMKTIQGAHAVKTELISMEERNGREEPGQIGGLIEEKMKKAGLEFPIILKPDAAQRGAGVKKISSLEQAMDYVQKNHYPVLLQELHPGPHEAGIFYYRMPGEKHGKIFSITDKVFPVIVGDGHSTVRELIWKHPRYRMQAGVFMERHKNDQDHIPSPGERIALAFAGNHCQGTMFVDGKELITKELEKAVDREMQKIDGFFIGRIDVRYQTHNGLKSGKEFKIIEVNGAMSESTNIYDPAHSVFTAWKILFAQWRLTYRIGSINANNGATVEPFFKVLRLLIQYYSGRKIQLLSD